MRREGYELAVSKPQVIFAERGGVKYEPVEYVVVDVGEAYAGSVIEALGKRRATMSNMIALGDARRLEYTMPTRAIFGLRGELLTLSRGTAIMSHTYYDHQPWNGEIPGRNAGTLIASETGSVTAYALAGLESRGRFFIGPGVEVYEGMIVGRAGDDRRERQARATRGAFARACDRIHRRRRAGRSDPEVDPGAKTAAPRDRTPAQEEAGKSPGLSLGFH